MTISENFTSADLDIFVFECDSIYDPANIMVTVMVDDLVAVNELLKPLLVPLISV